MLGLVGSAAAENQQWWPVRNDSGEEVPPFACMRITGMFAPFTTGDGSFTTTGYANMGFTISKPNTFASQYSHLFNGPRPIAAGAVGQGVFGRVMAGRYTGTAPTVGNQVGPINNSWLLSSTSFGFTVTDTLLGNEGVFNTLGFDKTVRVIQAPALFLRGTTTETIGSSGGLVSVSGSSETVTAKYDGSPSISSGVGVYLHWYYGTWYAAKL